MTTTTAVSPALAKAAEAAWAHYASACRYGGLDHERRLAYQLASAAERRLQAVERR